MPGSPTFSWGQLTITVAQGETATVTSTATTVSSMSYSVGDTSIATATPNSAWTSWTIQGVAPGTTTVTISGAENAPDPLTITVTSAEDESYLNKRGLTHFWENIDILKQDKLTVGSNITISDENVISAVQPTVDSSLSFSSINAVENQAITNTIYDKNSSNDKEAGVNVEFSNPTLNPYVHIGSKSSATKGNSSVGIGYDAESSAIRSVAIGPSATVTKREGVALGANATAGQYSLSIGYYTNTVPNYSTAVGPYAKVLTGATNATAIGYQSEASEAETISVGKSTNKRRIVNVADGTTATDAATVGQLPTKTSELINDSDFATKLYVQSRGENLVTNGSGLLQNNYNFSDFTFDPLVANGTPGSFRRDVLNSIVKNDELIPVDITKDYMFSFDIRTTNGSARFYDTIFSYDIDGNQIMYYNVNWLSGTTTTLSQKLSPGDTVVHLTSLSGWNTTTTYSYQKGFIFWNYVNSLGYAWGPETYSRNMYRNLYTDNSAVNKTANTITLNSAWAGPEIPAGTSVSQCTDGSNYIYIGTTNYTVTADTWVHRESILTKNLYRIGTAFVGVGWLANRDVTGTISTWFNNVKFYEYTSIPTVNNGQLTIQKNGSNVATFTANQSGNATANITVPTKTSDLTNDSNYVTNTTYASANSAGVIKVGNNLSITNGVLSATGGASYTEGSHIDITNNTISAVDYVHSDDPVSTGAVTPVVTNSMVASGTLTSDKFASGELLTLTMSTTDIGEGAPLAANTLYGVYE